MALLTSEFMAKLDGLQIAMRKVLAGRFRGERRSRRKGRSIEFADHREYAFGDDIRFLDWHLLARLDRFFLKLFHETFHEIVRRFVAAMLRAVPGLTPEEALWKLYFSVGAMAHVMATHDMLQVIRPEMTVPTEPEEIVKRLVPYVCGGIQASPPPPGEGSEEGR